MSIRLKLSLLLISLFLAAIFNALFTFPLESYGEEKLKWVNHTHEVLHVTEKLLGAIKDAETGQRGYLLTIDTSYLQPYHLGVKIAREHFDQLTELTSDNAKQQARLSMIKEMIDLKFDELAATINLVQNDQKNEALNIVIEDKGKQYMQEIRSQFSSFINAELILLEQRKGDLRENRAQITTLITVEIVFLIGLSLFTLAFLQRNFFSPLNQLLSGAKKVEDGIKLDVIDVVEKDEMGHLLSTFYVMSEKVHQREQLLDHKVHHDELTGLKNRVSIYKEIEDSLSDLQETGGKFAVLFLDLNLFKEINDTLGHDIGDLILQEAAGRLNASARSSDSVFRMGGDEFLMIARGIKDSSDVHSIARNILNAFKPPAMIQGKPIEISTSIGAAVSPDDSATSEEIVKFADIAMYVAKKDKEADYKLFDKSMLRRANDIG